MLRKPEQYSEASYHSLVLNAALQSIQTTAGTWDTYSLYQKAAILAAMEQLTELVTEVTAENSAQRLQTKRKNNLDNGKD